MKKQTQKKGRGSRKDSVAAAKWASKQLEHLRPTREADKQV